MFRRRWFAIITFIGTTREAEKVFLIFSGTTNTLNMIFWANHVLKILIYSIRQRKKKMFVCFSSQAVKMKGQPVRLPPPFLNHLRHVNNTMSDFRNNETHLNKTVHFGWFKNFIAFSKKSQKSSWNARVLS